MSKIGKAMLALLVASYLSSGAALLWNAYSTGKLLILPALLVSGFAFLGHLVTLDEDLRGGWSNPEGSRKIWVSSVSELFAKLAAFAVALMLFSAQGS